MQESPTKFMSSIVDGILDSVYGNDGVVVESLNDSLCKDSTSRRPSYNNSEFNAVDV